jgi:hypothetical protein
MPSVSEMGGAGCELKVETALAGSAGNVQPRSNFACV